MNEDDVGKRIGSNIQRCRENLGLSKSGFASKIEMSKSQLSEYENGRKIPNTITLARIAEGLGITLDSLYYGPSSMRPVATAHSKPEAMVNCFAALIEYGIFEMRGYFNRRESGYVEGAYLVVSKHAKALKDLYFELERFNAKSGDYPDAEIVKKNILNAAAKQLQRLDEAEEAQFEEDLPF